MTAYYDLRPFPVNGGLAGQMRVWHLIQAGWAAACVCSLAGLVLLGLALSRESGRLRHRAARAASILSGALAIALTVVMWRVNNAWLRPGAFPVASVRGVENMTGLSFPKGTVLLEASGHSGWIGELRARLVMPRRALDEFLGKAPFDGNTSSTERPEWGAWWRRPVLERWDPESVTDFIAASAGKRTNGDSVTWSVLADVAEADTCTVYLEWLRG